MNSTFQTIYKHKSIRKFKEEPIPQNQYEALMKVISCIPTSINGQNFSIIQIEDQSIREKVANYAGKQNSVKTAPLFLVIVADFYRSHLAHQMAGQKMRAHKSIESVMVGSVDAGIILGQLIVAAESLGLGTVPIGGVRQQLEKVIKVLELPEYTFPVVGLCIGIPDETPDIKPRFNQDAVIFKDKYNKKGLKLKIQEYDQIMSEHNQKVRNINKNWTTGIISLYKFPYYPGVDRVIKKQGFRILNNWTSYLLNKVVQYYVKKNRDKIIKNLP